MCSFQCTGNYMVENKKHLSPVFLEVWQYFHSSIHTLVTRDRISTFKGFNIVTQKYADFLKPPENGRVIRSCRFFQAKTGILVLTVNVKINHWRKIHK